MTTLAVLKPDIRIERQEPLSPFGLLAQLFTEELLRRNAQELGTYRPMRLAYLEEEEREGAAAPPEIHFDLDVDLIVNRLLKDREKKEKQEKAKNEKLTPAERILERVILREKEIRIAYPETRRVVIEDGSRRITASLPLGRSPQAAVQAGGEARENRQGQRQAGEGRSTQKTEVLRPSASLPRADAPIVSLKPDLGRTASQRTLTLASQAMSVPAAGGWTPKEREVHPGYPAQGQQTAPGSAAGSILLPDVMRRRREAALERHESAGALEEKPEGLDALEESLIWAVEGAEESPETQRVLREIRRSVIETVHRNSEKGTPQREETVREERPLPQTGEARRRPEEDRKVATAAARPERAAAGEGAATLPPEAGPRRTGAAETVILGEAPAAEQAGAVVRSAAPAGAPEPVPSSPTLVYRAEGEEAPPEAAAQPVISGERAAALSAVSSMDSAGADTPRDTMPREAKPAPRRADREETVLPAREGGGQGARTALPPEAEEKTQEAAAMTFRMENEAPAVSPAAPRSAETGESPLPAGRQTGHSGSAAPGREVRPDRTPEGRAAIQAETEVRTAPQEETAVPSDSKETFPASATLVYRESTETAAPEAAAQDKQTAAAAETGSAPARAAQTGNMAAPAEARAVETAIPPEAPQRAEAAAEPVRSAAIPTEAGEPAQVPTVIVYREEAAASEASGESGGAGPAPAESVTSSPHARAESSRGRAVPAEAPATMPDQPGPAEDGKGERRLPAAIPSGAGETVTPPTEIVYREDAASQMSGDASQPSAAAEPAVQGLGAEKSIRPSGEKIEAVFPDRGPTAAAAVPAEPLPRESGAAEPALSAAVPARSEEPGPAPTVTVYREEGETSPAAGTQRVTEEKGSPASPKAEIRPAEATAEQSAVSRTAVQSAATAEPVLREPTMAGPALPGAIPAEAGEAEPAPAEIIYREGTAAEAAFPTAGPQRNTEKAQTSAGTEAPQGTTSPAKPNTSAAAAQPEDDAAQPAPSAALPIEEGEAVTAPAEIVYREGAAAEEAFPTAGVQRNAEKAQTNAGTEAHQGAASPTKPNTAAAALPEDGAAQSAPSAALPIEEREAVTAPAEIVYREGAAAEEAFPTAGAQRNAEKAQTNAGTEAHQGAASPTKPNTAAAAKPEDGTAQPAPSTALPIEEREAVTAPAEIVYREGVGGEGAFPTAGAQRNTDKAQTSAGREPSQRMASPAKPNTAAAAAQPEDGIAASAPSAAIPAEAAEPTPEAPALVYREEGTAPAPETAAQAARAGQMPEAAAPVLHRAAGPSTRAVSPGAKPAGASPRKTSGREADGGEEAMQARPTEPAEPAGESAVLVYREGESVGAAPSEERGPARTRQGAGESAPETEAGTPARKQGNGAAAVPAQPGNERFLSPISLHLRREEDHPLPAAAERAARDIRVTAELEGKPTLRGSVPGERPRAASGPKAGGRAPGSPAGEATVPGAMPIPVTAEAQEPASLIFAAPSQGAENAMEESGTRPVRKAQQDNTESLPPWAKELLEKSGVTDTTTQIAAFNGQQAGSSGGRQITWTAPGAGAGTQSRTADEGPAQIEYRERSGSEETPYRPQISDAEIQRTADKVYRIIEERLRRELRRSGR